MGIVIVVCTVLAVVTGKPATDVMPTSTPITMSSDGPFSESSPSSTVLPSSSAVPQGTSEATEPPREITDQPPPPVPDENAEQPWFSMGPGSRFLYHIPISPETEVRPEFWRFRDQPFYRSQVDFVPVFNYRRGQNKDTQGEGPGDEGDADLTQSNKGPKSDDGTEAQDRSENVGSETVQDSDEVPVKEEDLKDAPIEQVPFRARIALLPFGADRPAFRRIIPFPVQEDSPFMFQQRVMRPEMFQEGEQRERIPEFDGQQRTIRLPTEEDERFVGMIPLQRDSFLGQSENDRPNEEMIPPREQSESDRPNEEMIPPRDDGEPALNEEQPEPMPEAEQEQEMPQEQDPPQEQEPQEQEQEQPQEQSQEPTSPEEPTSPNDSSVDMKESEENPIPDQAPPEDSRVLEEEDQSQRKEEEEKLPEEERKTPEVQMPFREMNREPMIPIEQYQDYPKWFEDPQPFDTSFRDDPSNNMVENEIEMMRGNFERVIP